MLEKEAPSTIEQTRPGSIEQEEIVPVRSQLGWGKDRPVLPITMPGTLFTKTTPSGLPTGMFSPQLSHPTVLEYPDTQVCFGPEVSGVTDGSATATSDAVDGQITEILGYSLVPVEPPITITREEDAPVDEFFPHTNRHRTWVLAASLLLILILVGFVSSDVFHLGPFAPPLSASITLTPMQQAFSQQVTFSPGEAGERLLSSLSLTRNTTVATTGTSYTPALPAKGVLVFYNALPYEVTIPAHTRVFGNGYQAETLDSITIPGVVGGEEGNRAVNAQTVETGASANLPGNTFNAMPVQTGITVSNPEAFTEGQDKTPFQSISQSDVNSAKQSLDSRIQGTMQSTFQGDLKPGETLLSLLNCSPDQVQTDNPIGSKATQVTVTETESCAATAVNMVKEHQAIEQSLHIPDGYVFLQAFKTTDEKNTATQLIIQISGNIVYQWSPSQLSLISKNIAGMNQRQAQIYLEHLTGARNVTVTIFPSGTILPT